MPGIAERIKKDLVKNRRKAMVLGVLSIALVGFVAKMFFDMQPKTATAAPRPTASASVTSNSPESVKQGASLQERAKVSRELWQTLREKRGVAPANAFVFDTSYYNLDPSKRPVANNEPQARVETHVEKQPARNAEEIARQARIATIREQARTLVVRSTVLGTKPFAIINGQIYTIGGRVQGFEVTSIRAREVELVKEGVSVVIKMADEARGQ